MLLYRPKATKTLLSTIVISIFLWFPARGSAEQKSWVEPSTYTNIVVSTDQLPVKYAVIDLQRYLAQVIKEQTKVTQFKDWQKQPVPAIVVARLSDIREYLQQDISERDLGEQGYLIKKANIDGRSVILLGGNTYSGQVNAVYGLLRTLGYQFYLGSEFIPPSLPDQFTDEIIVKKPALKVRGTLPWYNFFNSPTAWDPIDHRTYIDQLIRSGANFITFHSYDHEPFSGYEKDGEMVYAEPLRNTSKENWGTHPMKTEDFFFGTDKLYDTEYFGAKTTLAGYDRDTQIKKERAILRDALLYAKQRGLKTSFGFSIVGDPTLKKDRERFIRQLEENLEYYNFLDYIFLWQRETKGAQGHPLQYEQHILPHPRKPNSKIVNYGNYRRNIFKRVVDEGKGIAPFHQRNEEGKVARATEGARLEMFGKLAMRVLSRYESSPDIVISGWGGETYLMSAEYYEGLDKLLPEDVVFSSLDHIQPQPSVDQIYSDLPDKRQRWPIPWLENDGDQWHPQPFVHLFESTGNNILESGSQGFLSIHWRTREVENNFAYLTNLAWNPDLSAEDYFATISSRFRDSDIAGKVKNILISLDRLGYRWVGGHGQNECAVFTWGSGEEGQLIQLRELKESLDALIPQVEVGKELLSWISRRMEWVINYYHAEVQAERAQELLKLAENSRGEEREKYAWEAYDILCGDALAKAMHSYAKRITTRGEYGVMATINTKAAYDWNEMYKRAQEILHIEPENHRDAWNPDTEIIVPRLYGSTEINQPLEISAIVLGGQPATLLYRQPGEHSWRRKEMEAKRGWVYSAIIEPHEVIKPSLEYAIITEDSTATYGPKVITVFPSFSNQSEVMAKFKSPQYQYRSMAEGITISVESGHTLLSWEDNIWADSYIVYLDNELILETPVNFYPLSRPVKNGQRVTVKAMRDNTLIGEVSRIYRLTSALNE